MKAVAALGRFFGSTMLFAIGGAVGVIVLLVLTLINDFHDAHQHAQVEAENVSRLLQEHALAIVQKVDLALRDVQRQVRSSDMRLKRGSLGTRSSELHDLLKFEVDAVPEVSLLHLINADGEHIHSSVATPPAVNLADREYFLRHRKDPGAGLVISSPIVSRVTGNWTLILSRRISFDDGSFAGTVQASLDMKHFQNFYRTLDLGSSGLVALYDKDMHLAARYPPSEKSLGKVFDLSAKAYIEQGIKHATYHGKSPVDNVDRLYSFQQVGDLPLIVFAGIAEADYLAESYRHVWQYGAGAAIFGLVVIGFGLRQRRAERELHKSEDDFRTIADYTYDWEYWEGPGQEMLFTSPSCERVTGYTPAEFLADPELVYRIIHPDDVHLMQEHRHDARLEDQASVDFRIVRRDGEIRFIAHGCRAVFGRDGKFMGRRGSNRDITERRRAEARVSELNAELELRVAQRTAQLEATTKELEEFSYSMSHDMRTPLRALDGFAKILLEEQGTRLDDNGRRLLNVLRDNARRAGQLMDDILRFMNLGRRRMEPGSVDLAELARGIFGELQTAAPERRMRLAVGVLPPAFGDRDMLRQALRELLSNAIKYSRDDGEAAVELAGASEEQENVYSVTDHGVGFDMRYADKLFRVFERVHPTGQYEGSGIGLAIVRRVISRHGGRVWAEGEVGKGASFRFTLPRPD